MYSQGGRSAQHRSGSSARSRTPPRLEEFEEADRTIKLLKRELESLRGESRGAIEIRGKIANLEHRYEILIQERHAEAEGYRLKELQLDVEITQLGDDLRTARDQLNSKERDVSSLRCEFVRLEKVVERIEDELTLAEKRTKSEMEEYERLLALKSEYDHEKGNVLNDQLKCNTISTNLVGDIEAMTEQMTKVKRKARELRNQLIDVRSQIQSMQKECQNIDEDINRSNFSQKAKEGTFKRLSNRAEGIRSECEAMLKEKNNVLELYNTKDDIFRALGDTKADHSRREAKLSQEKAAINSNIVEADKELSYMRGQVNELEGERSERQHELSSLKRFYDRLAEENRKLVELMRGLEQGDQKAIHFLNREDKIQNMVADTSKEIAVTLALLRG